MAKRQTRSNTRRSAVFVTAIYGLVDPRNGEIRYVGKTGENVERRLNRHLYGIKAGSQTHCIRWLKQLRDEGLRPTIAVFERVRNDEWIGRERWWIKELRDRGCSLANHTIGGDGASGFSISDSTRKKISAAGKKRFSDPAECKKMSDVQNKRYESQEERDRTGEAIRAYYATPAGSEQKKKHSEYMKNRAISEETRAKMAVASRRRANDPEIRKKISDALKGRVFSDETRRKMSESRTGKVHFSAEQRRRLSEQRRGEKNGMYGKRHSEESRARMADVNRSYSFELGGEIGRRYVAGGITQNQLAIEYGLSRSTIGRIVNRYKWKYVEV